MKPIDAVFALLMVVLIIDLRQTLIIAANPAKWTELNPILGPHPSRGNVVVYFAVVIGLVVAAYLFLVPMARPADALVVTTLLTVVQSAVVVNNHRIGIK